MKADFFRKDFLQNLSPDYLEAVVQLCAEFDQFASEASMPDGNYDSGYYQDFIEIAAIFESFAAFKGEHIEFPEFGSNKESNMGVVTNVIYRLSEATHRELTERTTQSTWKQKTNEYKALFNAEPVYEFSTDDYNRVQDIVDELRKMISASNLITPDHKRRLLRRLEAMQSELHKKTSDIDRFWGFVAEAGIVARKFGEDLKPITERVEELGKIVIAVVMAKEGIQALPDITKLLKK